MFWVFGAEPAAAIIIIITVGHESRDALLTKITQHEGWNDAIQVQTTQTDPLNKLRRRQNVLSPHVYFILLKKAAPERTTETSGDGRSAGEETVLSLLRKTRRSFSGWNQWQRLFPFDSGADSACRTNPQASNRAVQCGPTDDRLRMTQGVSMLAC